MLIFTRNRNCVTNNFTRIRSIEIRISLVIITSCREFMDQIIEIEK